MPANGAADTALFVETPEGIELELRPAGVVARGLAWLLDLLIRGGILIALSMSIGMLGEAGGAVVVVTAFALEWFYPVIGEVWFNGITPGKRALGIRVVRDDGAPVGLQSSLIRNLLRAVDFLPALNAFGVTSIVLSRRFQRLGDLAAGTLVVYDAATRERRPTTDVPPYPPPYPLELREQQLVLDFADRSASLSEARREELAACAGALVAGAPSPAQRLLGMAAWLGGAAGRQTASNDGGTPPVRAA